MSKDKIIIFVAIDLIIATLIIVSLFVPVRSGPALCSQGTRFSLIQGQLPAYEEAVAKAEKGSAICTLMYYEQNKNELFVF